MAFIALIMILITPLCAVFAFAYTSHEKKVQQQKFKEFDEKYGIDMVDYLCR